MNGHATDPDAPQFLVNRRPWQPTNPLETAPVPAALRPHGTLPNTPLTASLISFSLGIVFTLGALLFALGGIQGSSWATYQLGFFIAAWAAFHWGEFAVTAGWNRDKVSIDSFLLNNGKEYHLANGTVVVEFIITAYLFPSFKRHPYVSQIVNHCTPRASFSVTVHVVVMAKSKNHTAHNQNRKAHRNGIKKPKTNYAKVLNLRNRKFRTNQKYVTEGNIRVKREAKEAAKAARLEAKKA
ncbi:hypothetical protein FRB99_005280 [Tulasnella sp. 403]|nr:hypothetical protein FRB99_005280 [Tulasnella sp. 403]